MRDSSSTEGGDVEMKRRLFNILAAVSLMQFLVFLGIKMFLHPSTSPPMTTVITQNGDVETVTRLLHSHTQFYVIFGVHVPLPIMLLVTAALPLWWVLVRLVAMFKPRPAPGHCEVCGYDLRASPERCPECGTESKANGNI